MPAGSTGPLYGPLPELDPNWEITLNGQLLYAPEDTRDLILLTQGLRVNYTDMHRLSLAMNSAATLSLQAVSRIKADVVKWIDIDTSIQEARSVVPATLSPGGLPLKKADVVEYSEEPLKSGKNFTSIALQPLQEEQARLGIRICLALDLINYELPAPCCVPERVAASLMRS